MSTRRTLGGALAAAAVALAAARAIRATAPPAPPGSLFGSPRPFAWRHADLFRTVGGPGGATPAVLLHDLYTGASSDEVARLADRLAERFEVHAVDLPGFGRSGRPRLRYTPDLMTDAIVELVRHGVGRPALLVASGLAGAYATEAALRLGGGVRGLVLLAPPEPGPAPLLEAGPLSGAAYQALRSPLGEVYHRIHASAWWRRHALGVDLAADVDRNGRAARLRDHALAPGSAWPLWSLWTGQLRADPRRALARAAVPALVLWGAEARSDPSAPRRYAEARTDLAQAVVPGTGRWPHVDDPDGAAARIVEWSAGALDPAGRPAPAGAR